MKLLRAEFAFDGSRLTFYFSADRPGRLPPVGQGPRIHVSHRNRVATGRAARRDQADRWLRPVRPRAVLLVLAQGLRAGIDADGQEPGSAADRQSPLGRLWPVDVLPGLRERHLSLGGIISGDRRSRSQSTADGIPSNSASPPDAERLGQRATLDAADALLHRGASADALRSRPSRERRSLAVQLRYGGARRRRRGYRRGLTVASVVGARRGCGLARRAAVRGLPIARGAVAAAGVTAAALARCAATAPTGVGGRLA